MNRSLLPRPCLTRLPARLAALGAFALLGVGCATAPMDSSQASQDFLDCRDEALGFESAAAEQGGHAARYQRAASLAEQCLALGPAAYAGHEADAMRLHGVSVLALVRAGEIGAARDQLAAFESRFPGQDLYFADRASLLESLHALLAEGGVGANVAGNGNIGGTLRRELQRVGHWQQH